MDLRSLLHQQQQQQADFRLAAVTPNTAVVRDHVHHADAHIGLAPLAADGMHFYLLPVSGFQPGTAAAAAAAAAAAVPATGYLVSASVAPEAVSMNPAMTGRQCAGSSVTTFAHVGGSSNQQPSHTGAPPAAAPAGPLHTTAGLSPAEASTAAAATANEGRIRPAIGTGGSVSGCQAAAAAAAAAAVGGHQHGVQGGNALTNKSREDFGGAGGVQLEEADPDWHQQQPPELQLPSRKRQCTTKTSKQQRQAPNTEVRLPESALTKERVREMLKAPSSGLSPACAKNVWTIYRLWCNVCGTDDLTALLPRYSSMIDHLRRRNHEGRPACSISSTVHFLNCLKRLLNVQQFQQHLDEQQVAQLLQQTQQLLSHFYPARYQLDNKRLDGDTAWAAAWTAAGFTDCQLGADAATAAAAGVGVAAAPAAAAAGATTTSGIHSAHGPQFYQIYGQRPLTQSVPPVREINYSDENMDHIDDHDHDDNLDLNVISDASDLELDLDDDGLVPYYMDPDDISWHPGASHSAGGVCAADSDTSSSQDTDHDDAPPAAAAAAAASAGLSGRRTRRRQTAAATPTPVDNAADSSEAGGPSRRAAGEQDMELASQQQGNHQYQTSKQQPPADDGKVEQQELTTSTSDSIQLTTTVKKFLQESNSGLSSSRGQTAWHVYRLWCKVCRADDLAALLPRFNELVDYFRRLDDNGQPACSVWNALRSLYGMRALLEVKLIQKRLSSAQVKSVSEQVEHLISSFRPAHQKLLNRLVDANEGWAMAWTAAGFSINRSQADAAPGGVEPQSFPAMAAANATACATATSPIASNQYHADDALAVGGPATATVANVAASTYAAASDHAAGAVSPQAAATTRTAVDDPAGHGSSRHQQHSIQQPQQGVEDSSTTLMPAAQHAGLGVEACGGSSIQHPHLMPAHQLAAHHDQEVQLQPKPLMTAAPSLQHSNHANQDQQAEHSTQHQRPVSQGQELIATDIKCLLKNESAGPNGGSKAHALSVYNLWCRVCKTDLLTQLLPRFDELAGYMMGEAAHTPQACTPATAGNYLYGLKYLLKLPAVQQQLDKQLVDKVLQQARQLCSVCRKAAQQQAAAKAADTLRNSSSTPNHNTQPAPGLTANVTGQPATRIAAAEAEDAHTACPFGADLLASTEQTQQELHTAATAAAEAAEAEVHEEMGGTAELAAAAAAPGAATGTLLPQCRGFCALQDPDPAAAAAGETHGRLQPAPNQVQVALTNSVTEVRTTPQPAAPTATAHVERATAGNAESLVARTSEGCAAESPRPQASEQDALASPPLVTATADVHVDIEQQLLALADQLDPSASGEDPAGHADRWEFLQLTVPDMVSTCNNVQLEALNVLLAWLLQQPAGAVREHLIDVIRQDPDWLQGLLQCWQKEMQLVESNNAVTGAGPAAVAAGRMKRYTTGWCHLLLQLLGECCQTLAAGAGMASASATTQLDQLGRELLRGSRAILTDDLLVSGAEQRKFRMKAGLWRGCLNANLQRCRAAKMSEGSEQFDLAALRSSVHRTVKRLIDSPDAA